MSQDKQSHRRTDYFIKKDFQFKFILKFCLLVFIGVVISTVLLFLLSQDTLTSSFEQSRLVVKKTGLAILPSVVYTNLITLGLITIATIIVTLFVSHKMAGPMFRFEEELKEIGKGNLTKKVMIRKKDQIADMAVCLNNMVSSLHAKVLDIQTEVEHIRQSASRQNAPTSLIEELNRLHQKIGSSFKI
jgi:methyl-accepting chemotaxis protein